MKKVIEFTDQLQRIFDEHPVLKWISGEDLKIYDSTEAMWRLRLISTTMIHWGFTFSDIMKFGITFHKDEMSDDPEQARLQKSINIHAEEDASHLLLLMEDMEKLKTLSIFNNDIKCFLEYYWNPKQDYLRRHSLLITKLIHPNPILRFPLIEAMEKAGQEFLRASGKATSLVKMELRWFGRYHLDLETGHLLNQEEKEAGMFEDIVFTEEQAEISRNIVVKFYEYITDFCDAVLEIVTSFEQAPDRNNFRIKLLQAS